MALAIIHKNACRGGHGGDGNDGSAKKEYKERMLKRKIYPAQLTREFEVRIDAVEASKAGLTSRYRAMNALLRELTDLLTADMPYAMSGTYAKIDYIATTLCPSREGQVRILRLHCNRWRQAGAATERSLKADIRSLRHLASLLSCYAEEEAEPAPPPEGADVKGWPATESVRTPWRVLRARVVDGRRLSNVLLEDIEDGGSERVDLSKYDYMASWLRKGVRLNLIYHESGGMSSLSMVVYEPDFLIDVTSVTSCFAPYCVSHRLFFIRQLSPNPATRHTLLGNLAGQFLDECLAAMRDGRGLAADYAKSVRLFFSNNALALAAARDIDSKWHDEARGQQRNVAQALLTLREADPLFSPHLASTEASLISADLGLRGRADLLQSDWGLLIEQKSGKMDTFNHVGPKEDHYLQMMLYKLILSVCYQNDRRKSSQYFLYSRYPAADGLIRTGASMSPKQAYDTMSVRNSIVHDLMRYGDPVSLRADLTSWTVDWFRQRSVSDKLWEPYSKPELENALVPIQMADQLTQAYFFEMLAFAIREDIESRVGSSSHGRNGFADLWNTDYADRVAAGSMLTGLRFKAMRRDEEFDTNGECSILELLRESDDADGAPSPNFRTGDPVNLYDYAAGQTPDILRTIAHRATLLRISEDGTIAVKLRSAQPPGLFNADGRLWAIDHDVIESANMRAFGQLANLLRSTPERRSLILGTRKPVVDDTVMPRLLDHGAMNELVERQLAAREAFLLVGPPGTGKTSCGLMSILREELAHDGHTVLLMSYTNRAVDEICSKLEKDGLDYLRIGSRYACAEAYRGRLLISQRFANVDAVRGLIEQKRIFVGTTSSICGASVLFGLKGFDLAIVDEASQILEPSIVGILSETRPDGNMRVPAIRRFVLIGDQKQLPAVVQQNRSQSAVADPRLRKIGLYDCRDSFFERMIRLCAADGRLTYTLTRQGRMHPDVSLFSNAHFYGGNLAPIPLAHQSSPLDLSPGMQEDDDRTRLLATRRTLYVDSHSDADTPEQDKVNPHEADIVSDMAIRVLKIYARAGKSPRADQTLGIVVPYRNQITAIRARLMASAELPDELQPVARDLTIDTVERYQGSERDVMIYGLTASHPSQLEFLKDSSYDDADGSHVDRKLNVALTRAREQLIVVGDYEIMRADPLYAELAQCMNAGMADGGRGVKW